MNQNDEPDSEIKIKISKDVRAKLDALAASNADFANYAWQMAEMAKMPYLLTAHRNSTRAELGVPDDGIPMAPEMDPVMGSADLSELLVFDPSQYLMKWSKRPAEMAMITHDGLLIYEWHEGRWESMQ